MNWLNTSIQNKLMAIIICGSVAIFIASISAFQSASHGLDTYDELISVDITNERLINKMLINFKTQVQEWKNTLLRGYDTKNREKYWERFQKREQSIQESGTELLANLPNGQAKDLVSSFLASHKEMGIAYRKGFSAFEQSGYDHKAGDKAVKGIDREPAKLLSEATKLISEEVALHNIEVSEHAHEDLTLFNLVMIAVILLFAGTSFLVIRAAIVNPSRTLIDTISKISQGHIHNSIDIRRDDELGKLAKASRDLQDFLQSIADQFVSTNQQLSNASQELYSSSESVSGRISSANDSADHIASAMTEMSATAQEVASHAASAASLASEADTAAHGGVSTMNQAQTSIDKLASQISNAVSVVQSLEENTNNVGTVLSVIRGIAEQTNLLALNAAIEAARAGEQGRGFAVVADEVRTLAQKTQQSTEEIEEIIHNVQEGAKETVSVMDVSFEITQNSAEMFTEANTKLGAITESITRINELNMQVATAAEEQTSVSEDITKTIVEMADLIEATASSSKSSVNTAHTLNDIAQDVAELSSSFK